jgi:hypothetical protein
MVGLTLVLAIGLPWASYQVERSSTDQAPGFEGALMRLLLIQIFLSAIAAFLLVVSWVLRARGPYRPDERRQLVIAAAVFGGLFLALQTTGKIQTHVKGSFADWMTLEEWCGRELPIGAKMLVPLNQVGLRVRSRQIPAVDFQEGMAMLHWPPYLPGYLDKLALYGFRPSGEVRGLGFVAQLDPLDRNLSTSDAQRIGKALGAHWAVRRAEHPAWSLPERYRNASFVIYELSPDEP